MKYRSRTEIVSEILTLASSGEGISKTRIMYGAYLSYDQLKEYLSLLLVNRLLEKKGVQYKTTSKGLEYVKQHEKLGSMLELVPENDTD